MSDAITAAAIGSAAPTLASLLAYANARAARRQTQRSGTAALGATVNGLLASSVRTEGAVGCVEAGVGELRERVARLEGRLDGQPGALRRAP